MAAYQTVIAISIGLLSSRFRSREFSHNFLQIRIASQSHRDLAKAQLRTYFFIDRGPTVVIFQNLVELKKLVKNWEPQGGHAPACPLPLPLDPAALRFCPLILIMQLLLSIQCYPIMLLHSQPTAFSPRSSSPPRNLMLFYRLLDKNYIAVSAIWLVGYTMSILFFLPNMLVKLHFSLARPSQSFSSCFSLHSRKLE